MNTYAVTLDQFEGPLDLLVHLIQKKEVDAAHVEIQKVILPFQASMPSTTEGYFDSATEFILLASHLALLKSKVLLPCRDMSDSSLELEEDPKFDIIHHLIDYCRFKEAAQLFADREMRQGDHYQRGIKEGGLQLPTGLSGVTLDELGALFSEVIKKRIHLVGKIDEEEYRLQDKIAILRKSIRNREKILFLSLFEEGRSKIELIVIFLSLLELIKNGEVRLLKTENEIYLYGV